MEWIKTSEQMPPKGEWVLCATPEHSIPWEIRMYEGIGVGKEYVSKEHIEREYNYPRWRVKGGVASRNPIAWMPLPKPYNPYNDVN